MILDAVLPNYRKVSQAPARLPSGVVYDLRDRGRMTEADWKWLQAEQDKRYKAIDELGRVWLVQNPVVRPWALQALKQGGVLDRVGQDRGQVFVRHAPPKLALTPEQARAQASLVAARGDPGDGGDGFGADW